MWIESQNRRYMHFAFIDKKIIGLLNDFSVRGAYLLLIGSKKMHTDT